LRIDLASCTVTLDDKQFSQIDPDACKALSALRTAQLTNEAPLSKKKLSEKYLKNCNHDTTLSRWFDALPEKLRDIIDGKSGAGLSLVLPPLC